MMKTIVAIALTLMIAPVAAQAADGSSGCGAGWYVFTKNSLLSSVLRGTTNGIFLNQTFGMTFGTSNCQKHEIVQKEKEATYFAESNQPVLMIQLAEGRGEYVDGFAQVMGCDSRAFGTAARNQYEQIFPRMDVSAGEMLENTKAMILRNPELLKACGVLVG